MSASPDSPIVLMTRHELGQLVTDAIATALEQQQRLQLADKRVPSSQAAAYLGCQPNHLHALHKRGLPYEKGRPNFYRQADLDAYRATLRLGASN